VPIITAVPNSLDSTQLPRATVSQSWAFIISELQQAATLLHGKVWDAADQGRATEWAAKALLGKAYVFTQDWADAKTTLLDVINNSGKALMPFNKYDSAFIGIAANEFNEESLFEINVERDPTAGYGVFANNINLTTAEGLPLGPGILGDDGYVKDDYCMGYGNEYIHDRNLARFGYTYAKPALVANAAFNPNNPPGMQNSDSTVTPLFRSQNLALRTSGAVDPRLWVNALQPWIDSVSNDGGQTWRPEVGYPNIPPLGVVDNYYGWSFRKYNTFTTNIFNVQAADGANIYILRLADVFLLYAEACLNTADNTDALEYINKVHRRAYNYPYNAPSPVDYSSLSGSTPAAVGGDPVLGNNPLYYERWAELMGEGDWWFDVCRWQIGTSEAAWYRLSLAAGAINFDPKKSYVLPIPITEMQANVKAVQNAGY
jgi:starch-binding outer membrane protein, SusD/RagB family